MSMRAVVAVLLIGIATLGFYAWSRNTARPAVPSPAVEQGSGGGEAASGAPAGGGSRGEMVVTSGGDPGITWQVPKRWKKGEDSPARLATYSIPKAAGDSEDARCAVFYFGPGQGGDPEANLARWKAEFDGEGQSERATFTVHGFQVERVRVRGTYLAHAGMGTGSDRDRHGFELLGAIVERPDGPVFFKLTGPARTVDGASREFQTLLESIRKSPAGR